MVTLTLALTMACRYNLRLNPRNSNNAVQNFIFESLMLVKLDCTRYVHLISQPDPSLV